MFKIITVTLFDPSYETTQIFAETFNIPNHYSGRITGTTIVENEEQEQLTAQTLTDLLVEHNGLAIIITDNTELSQIKQTVMVGTKHLFQTIIPYREYSDITPNP